MPPLSDVPPMTAAEITSSSLAVPEAGHGAVEPRRLHGRADRAQRAHQDERQHDRPADVDAAELGGLGVAADGVDVPSETAPPGEVGHHDGDADEDHHRIGDAGRDLQPALRFDDAVALGVLRGELRRPRIAVGDPHRAEDDGARRPRRCRSRPRAAVPRTGSAGGGVGRRRCRRRCSAQAMRTEQPAAPLAERAARAAAEQLEVAIHRAPASGPARSGRSAPRQIRIPPSVTMNDGTPM